MSTLVGVDVGGSGLRCQRVTDGVPGPVHRAPGARITPAGIDLDALVTAVEMWLPRQPPAPDVLVWSMRGLLGLAEPDAVLAEVRHRLRAARTVVCTDALSSLVGALGGVRPGAVVAAGTGAVAFGTDFDHVWRRIDGWGHVLGDRGSAAWIGLQALQSGLRARDGVSLEGRALLAAGTQHLGSPETWPRAVMTRDDVAMRLAALAPAVAALAPTDPEAARICEAAGHALAETLAAAAHSIAGARLGATGGLLRAVAVRDAFGAACARLGLTVEPALGSSLDGSLHLARHVHGGGVLAEGPPYLVVG